MNQNSNDIAKKIVEADRAYHNTGHTILTDQEYDSLKALLKQLDPDHPLFSKVGDLPKSSLWKKAHHQIPMGSLEKVNTVDEFTSWTSKFPDEKLILEPKLDGLSLSLVYEDGKFVQAITRGDGSVGEDISVNVRNMKNFQDNLKQKFTGSLRCEIILPVAYLDKINSILPESDRYENCRNAASGISRRLDGRFTQYLQLLFYDIQREEDVLVGEEEKINFLRSLGFETVVYSIGDKTAMITSYNQLKDAREKLPYRIDGSVIKINSTIKQRNLGETNGRPKGQIAWKFDPPGSATILISVSWEVGRTGVVTPIGHVDPVAIDGSTIRNVTLHNIAEIERLGVGVGDLVMVIKANDIIPKITTVIESKGAKIEIPTRCPSCGSIVDNDGIRLLCKSDTCTAKNHFRIMNWIKITGIDNFGESTLSTLENLGRVRSIKDIYSLQVSDLSTLGGYGDKSATKIIQNIQKTSSLPLDKFLAGIGIPSLSIKTALDLVLNFKTIEAILGISVDDLKKIKGYSDISSNLIVSGLKNFSEEITGLLSVIKVTDKASGGKLSGMSFCFTGTMDKPRPYYQEVVQKLGGKNDSTVTKTTTYLVCNENKGSAKSQKAEKFGVKIITEQEFLNIVGDLPVKPEKIEKVKTYSLFDEE